MLVTVLIVLLAVETIAFTLTLGALFRWKYIAESSLDELKKIKEFCDTFIKEKK